MQPSNIYQQQPNTEPNTGKWQTIAIGWRQASAACKVFSVLSTLLLLSFGAYAVMQQGPWLVLSLCYIPVMWCQYFADKGRRQDSLPALFPHCRVEQGQCYIGETALPKVLTQVAIGIVPGGDRVGYLQLAWNGGLQWTFPPHELPAIRSWLLQHYPALKIVS
jgi:hypothetical protein